MSSPHTLSEEIQDAAAVWLSRRDRGLSAAEQDAYLEWLYQDPLHGRAIVQLERVWTSLNRLEHWRPAHSAVPNPDLLAPRRSSRRAWWATALAAAAAIMIVLALWPSGRTGTVPEKREAIIHPGPERMTLADGSVVELNQGARLDVQFTAAERRVRLLGGEAHFTVAKNPDRPFLVDTGRITVRAVGTAFSVALAATEVAVLVTEGRVAVQPGADEPAVPPVEVGAGQRTVVTLAARADSAPPVAPLVRDVTPAEIERALAWQGLRLEFVEMPLRDVAAAFNRYNRRRLVIADDATGAILVDGNFRADNVDAFVRLLDSGFGVSGFRVGDEITLRRTH